jgi:hypothetical protein
MLAMLIVMAFWAAAAAIWPLAGAVVPWDSKNHFYPMLRYLGASLANGEWPLWNPYHFSGHPSVADPQSLLFTPTMLLFGWLVPAPSMQLFDLVIFAHFIPGALGIVGLFRRRGWHAAGAVVAAMLFILGGAASARLQHTGMIFSYGFFPLALLLLEETLARRSYLFGILFAVVAAVVAVGRDQVAFLCCLALAGAVVHAWVTAERPLTWLRERLLLLGAVTLAGIVILAVPALLTIQFLIDSNRPEIAYNVAIMGSLHPSSLATALFGDVFGSLRASYDYWGPGPQTLPEGTWTDRSITYLFAGTLSALLLLWHGVAGGRVLARDFRYFLILGIGAILYALGRYTPVFDLLFHHVPGVDLYRRPADATFIINFAFAMATGYLVHRYVADGLPKLRAGRHALVTVALVGVAAALVIMAVVSGFDFAARAKQVEPAVRAMLSGLAIATLGALVLVVGRRRPELRFVAACLVALGTAGELIARNAASALNAEPHQRYFAFESLPPEQVRGLQLLKDELAARHARGERPRVEILGLAGAWQNASMVFGLEDTIGYNPLRIAGYARAVGPGENAADSNLRSFPRTFAGYRCRLASLLGLEYLVLDRPIEKMPARFPRVPNANLIYGVGAMWIYKFPPTTARAYLASRLVPVDSEATLDKEELPDFDRTTTALIDEWDAEGLKGDYGQKGDASKIEPPDGTVIIRGYRRNAVVLTVETKKPAVLVLHDIYYPGWEVLVDGEKRDLLRVNLLFRGVELPPGRHRVQFQFRPLSVNNLFAAASDLVNRGEEEEEEAAPGANGIGQTILTR